jgi:hypothetical protein
VRYALLALVAILCAGPSVARAQPSSPEPALRESVRARASSPPVSLTAAGRDEADESERGAFERFVRDVGGDYRNFFSVETAEWLAVGGVAALSVHGADEAIRDALQDPADPVVQALDLEGGAEYGNLSAQLPLAAAWWSIAHATGHSRAAAAGRDLVRAQISALSWTYAFKYTVNRTRPNGDPRSFPSGHSSAAFATAMVIQDHYGWKLGVPFFAAASYTAASRLTVNKHWASDVVFGAVVGMACARTVTVKVREARLSVRPQALPRGAAVMVSVH